MSDNRPIYDEEITDVTRWLEQALHETNPDARHERVGRAVRALTLLWAQANPGFGADAWNTVSFMVEEHWDQIRHFMAQPDGD